MDKIWPNVAAGTADQSESPISASKAVARYEYIDSLRGLAALSVIYYHLGEFYPPDNALEKTLFSFFVDKIDLGKIAVTVFFAISGYVIPFSLFRPGKTPVRNFAISRFFRLYPAYWLSLLLYVGLNLYTRYPLLPIHVLLVNVTMLQQFIGLDNAIGVYWTLQIELIFYLLCAMLFATGFLRKPRAVLAIIWLFLLFAVVLAVGRHVTGKALPVAMPLALSVMFFGFLWREFTVQNAENLRAPIYAVIAGFVLGWPVIFLLGYGAGKNGVWQYTPTYYSALVIFLLCTTRFKIESRLTAYLGRISYSLYLVSSLATVLGHYLLQKWFQSAPTYLVGISATLLGVAVASLSYYCLERPAIAMGRSLCEPQPKSAPPTEREVEEAEVL